MILPEKKTAPTDRSNREICDENGWKVGDRLILEPCGYRVAVTAIGLWHVLVALLDSKTDEPTPNGELEMNLSLEGWRKIDSDKPSPPSGGGYEGMGCSKYDSFQDDKK